MPDKNYFGSSMMAFYGMSAAGAVAFLSLYGGVSPALTSSYLVPVAAGVGGSWAAIKALESTKALNPDYMMYSVNDKMNIGGIGVSVGLGAAGAALAQRFL